MTEKQSTIKIWESTRKKLDKIKHPGQSYDGMIRELMATVERAQNHEERIRRLEREAGVRDG